METQIRNLKDVFIKFKDEEVCKRYLVMRRWKGVPTCVKCGCKKVYNLYDGRYKCSNNTCYHKFSVITGTFMESSNIPLSTWFAAIYLVVAHKKGISSVQLGKDLSVTQKTAWFMLQRIRESFKDDKTVLGNVIEMDETLVGGSVSNKTLQKRAEWAQTKDRASGKSTVLAMVERNGLVITKHIPATTKDEIFPIVKERTKMNSVVVTDTATIYQKLNSIVLNPQVNHSANEYVRGAWYTNTVEGFFSQLKRSIYGIYHQVSPKHLQRYCDETSYRYNTSDMKDPEKFEMALNNFEGRITYNQLIQKKPVVLQPAFEPKVYKGYGHLQKPVVQMLDGKEVARFESATKAANELGIIRGSITKVLGKKKGNAGGFQWVYA